MPWDGSGAAGGGGTGGAGAGIGGGTPIGDPVAAGGRSVGVPVSTPGATVAGVRVIGSDGTLGARALVRRGRLFLAAGLALPCLAAADRRAGARLAAAVDRLAEGAARLAVAFFVLLLGAAPFRAADFLAPVVREAPFADRPRDEAAFF
jgi:hypothetical protein